MPLAGVTLVRRCVDNFAAAGIERIVVTIPDGEHATFDAALDGAVGRVECVVGGHRRQDSVRLALDSLAGLEESTIVVVHDAARPLVPAAVVDRVVNAVRAGAGAVLPALPVVDSIRQASHGSSVVVDRAGLRAVQTPQGFRFGTLRTAHDHVEALGIDVTDDAAACEIMGVPVVLVDGDRRALKITEAIDLLLAEAILSAEGPV